MKNIPSYNDVAITIRWLVTHKNQCEHVSSEWDNIIRVIDYLSALSPKKVVSALRQAETIGNMIAANDKDYAGRPLRYAGAELANDLRSLLEKS
jgi:hypothetical protein